MFLGSMDLGAARLYMFLNYFKESPDLSVSG